MTNKNFTLGEKYDIIVQSLLNYSKINLDGKELYSWEFTPEHLNPEEIIMQPDLPFHNVDWARPHKLSAAATDTDISAKLYLSESPKWKNLFLIQVKVIPSKPEVIDQRYFAITNVRPWPTLFKDDEWHCDVGKWYNGLK